MSSQSQPEPTAGPSRRSVLRGAAGAGAVGLAAAWLSVVALANLRPENLPQLAGVHIDARVLLYTLGLSLATGVLFGIIPALPATRGNLGTAIREGGRSGTAGRRRQLEQHAPALLAYRVGAQRLVGRRCERLAGAQAELRAVARAGDPAVLHRCLRQRLAVVRAAVFHRVQRVAAAHDDYREPLDQR